MGRRVFICGYPKSGNTWLTRLTADLLGCPSGGFLEPDGEIRHDNSTEGLHRVSRFVCHKTHLRPHQLQALARPRDVIITVVRDPRDVLISSRHHFQYRAFESYHRQLREKKRNWQKAVFEFFFKRRPRYPEEMAELMLRGGEEVHPWLTIPWKQYINESLESGVCVVRYEDLLADSPGECRRILQAVGVERTEKKIADVSERQSFSQRRKQFEARGQKRHVRFLREGRAGQWREELSPDLLARLDAEWGSILQRLGYTLSTSAA